MSTLFGIRHKCESVYGVLFKNYQQALLTVLGVVLCFGSAVFANAKPNSETVNKKENVVILAEDPRPKTQPAAKPTTKPATRPAKKSITVEAAKEAPVVNLKKTEADVLAPPKTKPVEAKKAPKPEVIVVESEPVFDEVPAPKPVEVKKKVTPKPAPKAKPVEKPAVVKASKPKAEEKVKAVKPARPVVVKKVASKPAPKPVVVKASKPKSKVEKKTEVAKPTPVVVPVISKKQVAPAKKVVAPKPKAKPVVAEKVAPAKKPAKAARPPVTAKSKKPKIKVPPPTEPAAEMTMLSDAQKLGLSDNEMQELVMKLQMYNSELMQELQKGRKQNYKLIRALRESRKHSSDLQTQLSKKDIELQLKKLKKIQAEALKDGKGPTTTEELARQNRIMQLQLQLMKIDQPKRYESMLKKVAELSSEKEKVWANNRRLNDLLSKQANISEQRQEEINVIRPKLQQADKEIARLRMELKQLKASLTNPTPVAAPPVIVRRPKAVATPAPAATSAKPAPKPVTLLNENRLVGKIVSIDDQIIKINIGSLKGLQTGMRLIVYRRDKFVGYMRVDIVGETTSAGSMSREILVPQVGDSVTDRL